MRLSELLLPNEYTSSFSPEDINIHKISCQFNDTDADTLFVCLKGSKVDTHLLIDSICARGVAAIVAEMGTTLPNDCNTPIFYVASTRASLAQLWDRFVGEPTKALKLIGITGTNGKTSTAYLLDAILRENGYHTALIGTLGTYIDGTQVRLMEDPRVYTMTTPDPDILYPFLAQAKASGVTHVVMEVSSHALYYQKVAHIRFEDAVFTNLTPEHLDLHHTMEEYAETKKKLFLQTNHATINCDDACGSAIAASLSVPHIKCGILWEQEASATQLQADENDDHSYFYRYGAIRQLVKLRIAGRYQVYNSILALSSAISLGVGAGTACRALVKVANIPGRLQQVSTSDDDIRVYIDFAHTENALSSLLSGLKKSTQNRLVIVFGCGGERDVSKRPMMGRCAMQMADYSIITSDNCRSEDVTAIIKDILSGHTDAEKRRVIPDREAAIRYAILTAEKGDTIVLAGKGHEKYEIKHDGMHHFDETAIATSALRERRAKRRKVSML